MWSDCKSNASSFNGTRSRNRSCDPHCYFESNESGWLPIDKGTVQFLLDKVWTSDLKIMLDDKTYV